MKKNTMKRVVFLIVIVVFTAVYSIYLNRDDRKGDISSDNLVLYAACDSGADTVTAKFMNDFAERVEKKTSGKIKIETYSDSQVGGDNEIFEACQSGNISFVFQTTSAQVPFIKEAGVFDVPMAFDNIESAREVMDGELFERLKKEYKKRDIELLALADQGFRQMTSNVAVEDIEDFKGIKIRTMENPYHIMFWKLLGANPTPMSYSEVYIGLQQGIIDAQENPLEAIIVPKFYEQQDYLVETNHIVHTVTCIASEKSMEQIDEKYRNFIYEAAEESKIWARNTTDKQVFERIKTIEDSGTEIIKIDEKTREEMKKKSAPIWEKIESDLGKDIISCFR